MTNSKFKACFSAHYAAHTPTASMMKLQPVAEAARAAGYIEWVDPGFIDPLWLKQIHQPAYVDAFLAGAEPLASSQGWDWSECIRDGVLAIQAGQLCGARIALDEGIAANVAQGFHHAEYERGSDFCTFNGLALVAHAFCDKRIFVLDCDEHCGNGTSKYTVRLPNLFNYSICGTVWDFTENERSVLRELSPLKGDFKPYAAALKEAFAMILEVKPDLVLYQAGADPHQDDPLGSLQMTTAQLEERDQLVFRFCRKFGIPVLFVLAGGYQKPIETKLVPLHLNTFKAAYREFFSNNI